MSEDRTDAGEPDAGAQRTANAETGAPDEPVLPEAAGDERDEGWGDNPRERRRDEQWYRRQRPPHHE